MQRHLLRMIHSDYPDLMYPAALGCLADLEEVIKLNNLLHGTDTLPESDTFDAASSVAFGRCDLSLMFTSLLLLLLSWFLLLLLCLLLLLLFLILLLLLSSSLSSLLLLS